MTRYRPLQQVLALVLCVTVACLPSGMAWSDPMTEAAGQGQAAGAGARDTVLLPEVRQDGTLVLFPGTPNRLEIPSGQLFPGPRVGTQQDLQALYGDSNAVRDATATTTVRLGTEASAHGEAYRTLIQSLNKVPPDLTQDPIWGTTDATLGNLDVIARQFADCSVETTVQPGSFGAHVPDYRTCERVKRLGTERCELTRPLPTVIDVYVAAHGVEKNTFQFDLTTGAWHTVAPTDGNQFAAVVPVFDFNQLCPAGAGTRVQFVGAWDWPGGPVAGELDSSTCYRVLQAPSCANGLVGSVQLDDNCDEVGTQWYKYAAQYQFWAVNPTQGWGPSDCLQTWESVADGFCTGTATCTQPPDNAGCIVVGNVRVCEGDPLSDLFPPPPLPAIPRLCGAIRLETQCGYNLGALDCWTDPQGGQHCPVNNAGTTAASTCRALETDPHCGFIKSECVAGAQGASGTCYVFTDTYDCGFDSQVATLTTRSTYRCPGPVRCMGGECVVQQPEQNPDFARAAAALQAAQAIAADMNCGDLSGHNGVTEACRIFTGEAMECKKAVGGIVNCCERPSGVSLADYITLVMATLKLDGAITSWNATSTAGQALKGAWETLRQPIAQTWDTVTQPFTSAAESITGEASLMQAMINSAAEAVGELFGAGAQSALFTCTANCVAGPSGAYVSGTFQLAGWAAAAMTVLQVILWAYMIYQIAMILIQIIWKCEKDEFALGAKRELKTCHAVGSYCATQVVGQCIEKREAYCCFSSPLSRILQEQIRPQLGRGWGDAEDPDCEGIAVGDLEKVDWNRVNLDEWLGILAATGHLPTTRDLSVDGLTGSGNVLDTTRQRPNSQERLQNRIDPIDVDGVRRQVGQDLWGN